MGSRISSYSRLKKLILERKELIIEASKIKKEINTSFWGVIMSLVYHLAGDFYIYFLMNYHLRERKLKKVVFSMFPLFFFLPGSCESGGERKLYFHCFFLLYIVNGGIGKRGE